MKTLFLDTETTGLNSKYEELVEISLIDDEGNVLIDTLLKPTKKTEWKQAQSIHGISPDMVKDAPTFEDIAEELFTLINKPNQELVIYNANFDMGFIGKAYYQHNLHEKRYGNVLSPRYYCGSRTGIEIQTRCCMLEFARYYGEWNEYRNSYAWKSLIFAADLIGYEFEGTAHRALADTKACRAVWRYLEKKHIF